MSKDARSAQEGIKHIRHLYDIEDELREGLKDKKLDERTFLSERKTRAGPVSEKFKAWLLKRKEEVPPSLLLGKAIAYSLAQWDKLAAYPESPYLTPDNNACKNAIRHLCWAVRTGCFVKALWGRKVSAVCTRL